MAARRKNISDQIKSELLGRQFNCCNNRPGNNDSSFNIPGTGRKYLCPLWKLSVPEQGLFDESGYDADHIHEHSHGGTDDISNLQLLCPCCHSYKTKLLVRQPMIDGQRCSLTSQQRGEGGASMEELERPVQKGKRVRCTYDPMNEFGSSDLEYLKKLK